MHAQPCVDDTAWEAALAALPEARGDVYFSPGYHHLHDAVGVHPSCAVVSDGSARLVVPGLLQAIPGTDGLCDLQTCNGYGGPLASDELDDEWLAGAWQAWRRAMSERGAVAAFFRLHPLLENRRWLPSDACVVDDRQTVLIDLEHGLEAAWRAADSRFRNKVTRARKDGLEVRWNCGADWPAFEALYAQAMERLQASAALRFPPSYFERLRALPGVELGAIADDAGMVTGAVFLHGPRWSHYHLGARRADAKNHLMSFVFYAAMERAAARSQAGLHLGGGATSAPDDSLLRFKRRFSDRLLGFQVARVIVDEPRFNQLTTGWRKRTGRAPDWLLGYRQPEEAS